MTTPSTDAKRTAGYAKQPNDLISAREAVLLIDTRVSVLIAHWENERRQNTLAKRLWRRITGRT